MRRENRISGGGGNRCKGWGFFFKAEDGIRDGTGDWSSDVCSSDLTIDVVLADFPLCFLLI